jgi:hypothetical protein
MYFYDLIFLADTNIFLVLSPALPLEESWLRHCGEGKCPLTHYVLHTL